MLEKARMRREKIDNELAVLGDPKKKRAPLIENNPTTAPVIGKISQNPLKYVHTTVHLKILSLF